MEISKEELLEAIRIKLEKISMPSEIIIDKHIKIINPKKFFNLHLYCIGFISKNEYSILYSNRLKSALKAINIDINELAKEIKNKDYEK
jgi:hypothetical protein